MARIFFAVMIGILAYVQPAASLAWQLPDGAAEAAASMQGQTPPGLPAELSGGEAGTGSEAPGLLASVPQGHTLHLKSRDFTPGSPDVLGLAQAAQGASLGSGRLHFLVQLDFIPRQPAKDELEGLGLRLLDYVPDYGWIASAEAVSTAATLELPGVVWAGPLAVDDKLDPSIRSQSWGTYNYKDGTAAVYVVFYQDESLDTGRSLVEKYGGKVTSEVSGTNLLVVEMPEANLRSLAAEDAVQWIEPAEPPLGEANDGIRSQIGVNTVQGAPYGLNGSGVNVLVFDGGQVGDHVDFGTRLTHGDASGVEPHSTHVAGTLAGSGENSFTMGGITNQWKGMAPSANVISYGYSQTTGSYLFYSNPGDIEHDWAEAQNTYGAVIGTASLNTNAYMNYLTDPNRCANLMGRYGATSVLLDQIVRGGNAAVGLGEKYISTWAAGNERNSPNSCSDTYSSTSPPAGAKNPIQVGASNTNDNSIAVFSSWGPTNDGRLKPIVTAGGCQVGGDGGIKSTNNSPLNSYTVKCGTSMATPAVAGVIALMLQEYRNTIANPSALLWPSTIKALLMNTSTDLGNPGPDYTWGFGQVDAPAAVDLVSVLGFIQGNLSQGGVKTYHLANTSSASPLKVSLAWDDWEATFNANPALINNLDIELESPSGVIWRPWILNPAIPANNATRGIDTLNNQEMVEVPAPEVGTWLVRVKGTTVPHGPQDFSLACEGCQAIDLGICQSTISSASAALQADAAGVSAETGEAIFGLGAQLPTPGERWQDGLEKGPAAEAVPADDGIARQEETPPIVDQDTAEPAEPLAPLPRVSINAGPCTYATIQQAIDAAAGGNTIRISSGIYFETINISNKNLTLEGGFDATCTTPGTATTRLDGSLGSGSVVEVWDSVVTLKKLQFTWGSGMGAGVKLYPNAQVTLDASSVFNNHGDYGGGVYVSVDSSMTITNGTTIHDNTASIAGGGARVWGQFNGFTTLADTSNNCAADGGGFSVSGGVLNLDNADVTGNQAAGATGKGGGIHVFNYGTVTLANSVFVGESGPGQNTAYDGGGIYADASTVTLQGTATTVLNNTASRYGGGIYLANASTLHSTGAAIGYTISASIGNDATQGAGIYSTASTIDFGGTIVNNIAADYGAGIYANGGTVTLTGATVGGTGVNQPNQLGANGHAGVGLYLYNGAQAALNNTVVSSNIFQTTGFTYGGGIYVSGGTLTLQSGSRVELHNAQSSTDGRGAGIYAASSTVTIDNSRVNNNSAGAVGGGIRLFETSTLNVQNGASIDHNTAVYYQGGGIAAEGTPDINIDNATFQYNGSGTNGGAIFINSGTLDFTGWWDVRWNNAGGSGGAIAVEGTADADFAATSGAGNTLLAVNHADVNGGALFVSNADTVLIQAVSGFPVNLNTNSASGSGGALYSTTGALFDLYGQIIASSNNADGNGGLAYLDASRIYVHDTVSVKPQIWVNHAGGNGGAIYATNSSTLSLDGTVFGGDVNGNYVNSSGGALYLNNSTTSVRNCLFQNNKANLNGGAIYVSGGTLGVGVVYPRPTGLTGQDEAAGPSPLAPAITGCDNGANQCSDFHSNIADSDANNTGNGGAIFNVGAVVTVDATYFHNNSARMGGGIYQGGVGTTPSTLVRNSLFYANTSTGNFGGGIRNEVGDLTVSHVTLADSTNGAGFSANVGTVSKAINSIAWGNASGGFWGTFVPASSCNIDQSATIGTNIDPQFQPGSTYRLKPTSPGVDACPGGLDTDMLHNARPVGAGYDMGPYETGNLYVPLIRK